MDTSSLMSGEGKPPAASRSRPAPFLDSTTPSKPLKTPIIRGFSNWRDPTAPAEVLPLDPKSAGGRLWLSVCLFGTTHWLTSELTADASAGERLCLTRRKRQPYAETIVVQGCSSKRADGRGDRRRNTTNGQGVATAARFTANAIAGAYTVTATVGTQFWCCTHSFSDALARA